MYRVDIMNIVTIQRFNLFSVSFSELKQYLIMEHNRIIPKILLVLTIVFFFFYKSFWIYPLFSLLKSGSIGDVHSPRSLINYKYLVVEHISSSLKVGKLQDGETRKCILSPRHLYILQTKVSEQTGTSPPKRVMYVPLYSLILVLCQNKTDRRGL